MKIDPKSGSVLKTWNLYSLERAEYNFQKDQKGTYTGDVLNGIAYDADKDLFFLTGKRFHLIFKVKLN